MERAEECLALLRARGWMLASAESCTGGLIAKRLTDVAGASQAFCGGVVSYTNRVKEAALGVPHDTIAAFGPVSEPTARAMAEGVRALTGAELGVSVTGVAGPTSDERGNPVGTVYLALAAPDATRCRRFDYGARSREEIRAAAADDALAMVCAYLREADASAFL